MNFLSAFLIFAASITGTITYTGDEVAFVQRDALAMKVRFPNAGAGLPEVGDEVDVEGIYFDEGGRRIFIAASWKRTAKAPLPKPILVEGDELITAPIDSNKDVNWHIVEVEGRAIGLTERGFVMKIDELPINVLAEKLPDFMNDCGETRPKVHVTGVAELILDPTTSDDERYVMGVKILTASPEAVVLEEDLTYLMNRHDRRVRIAYIALLSLAILVALLLIVFLLRASRNQLRSRTIMQERKRMADDLHDTIEQHLVGAGMLLQLGKTQEAREILVRAKREMRDIVWGLKNDDMMRLSPSEMIRELMREENRKGICRVDVNLKGLPERLEAAQMRDLSLIVREAIGNAVKHGRAHKVAIAADQTEKGWKLRISNDGELYNPETAPGPKEGHFGVDGMRQRARRLQADVTIGVIDGRTVVTIESI